MYYVGGIDPNSSEHGIIQYLEERGGDSIRVTLFNSRSGDLSAKIIVPIYHGEIVEDYQF